ncbi:DDE superfamily endonuclease-domain-containing protein [Ustulina deusta]|nr:DDE superfamily endonuclease-domain-containing protein [Ustulina deusta]
MAPIPLPTPKLRGQIKKGIVRAEYSLPKPIKQVHRRYSKRRKVEVLLFIENHRIPLDLNVNGKYISISGSQTLIGASPVVEEGFRRPFLREAAAYFKISSKQCISNWWAQRETIFGGHIPRFSPRWPELEAILWEEFCRMRQNRRLVTATWFKRKATAIFGVLYPNCGSIFVFSNGWFRGFLRRHQISRRRVTHASTRVPEEIISYTNAFLQFIRRNSRYDRSWLNTALMSDPAEGISFSKFPRHLIINMDETPMPFEFLTGYTYDFAGVKSVEGKSDRSGWGKRQATLVLAITADGSYAEELKPLIIFHGKGNVLAKEEPLYHKGVDVRFNATAYNNEELFEGWIRTNLAAYTGGSNCLLVMDVVNFHKTPRVKKALEDANISTAMIPPGLTAYLQPLDVGFNGVFKIWLREELDSYLERLDEAGKLPDKWSVGARRVMATHIVGNAWKRAFTAENQALVAGLFEKTGISIHPDGRDDHLISIKGIDSSQLRLDDWYRQPGEHTNLEIAEVITALESGNEFLATAEVLGMPQNTYRCLQNKVLKEMCRQRGLYVSGSKIEMVNRLEDADAIQIASNNHQPHASIPLNLNANCPLSSTQGTAILAAAGTSQVVWENSVQMLQHDLSSRGISQHRDTSPSAFEFENDLVTQLETD